ncbi:hypothetical protein Tco_0662068 [Tanacetum coccineum]
MLKPTSNKLLVGGLCDSMRIKLVTTGKKRWSILTDSKEHIKMDVEKLTRPNFIDWYRQLRIVLSVEDKLNYLEHPIPAGPVPAHVGQQVPPEALVAHASWELKTLFAQQVEQKLPQTMREFHACKQEEGQCVSSYVLNMKSYIDNLERLDHPVSLNLTMVNELHAMIMLHKQTLPKKDAHALHAIRAGKVYDTGCGTLIYSTTQGLRRSRKLKPGALSLYIGNGQRVAVEAIGSYHLCFHSGLVVILHNYHYAPSIT